MALKIKTVLELYDLYVTMNIRDFFSKRISNLKILFCPPSKEIGFRRAQEKFNTQEIFPIIFVFRDSPPSIADENYSAMLYNVKFIDDKYIIKNVNVYLDYVISFYAYDLYDMNLFSISYYDFRSYRKIYLDFREIGFDFENYVEVMFNDLSAENEIETMYEKDLFFNYYFEISILVPLFEFEKGVEIEEVVLSLYNDNRKIVDIKK